MQNDPTGWISFLLLYSSDALVTILVVMPLLLVACAEYEWS